MIFGYALRLRITGKGAWGTSMKNCVWVPITHIEGQDCGICHTGAMGVVGDEALDLAGQIV